MPEVPRGEDIDLLPRPRGAANASQVLAALCRFGAERFPLSPPPQCLTVGGCSGVFVVVLRGCIVRVCSLYFFRSFCLFFFSLFRTTLLLWVVFLFSPFLRLFVFFCRACFLPALLPLDRKTQVLKRVIDDPAEVMETMQVRRPVVFCFYLKVLSVNHMFSLLVKKYNTAARLRISSKLVFASGV